MSSGCTALLARHLRHSSRSAVSQRRSAGAKKAALQASGHLQRSETWNGLRAGDRVVVSGVAMGQVTWEFRAHVVNTNNGTESIEVVGGRPGERTIRAFGTERIYAAKGKRSTNWAKAAAGELPLSEAPQLPFG